MCIQVLPTLLSSMGSMGASAATVNTVATVGNMLPSIGTVMSAGGSILSGISGYQNNQAQAKIAKSNAAIADQEAQDAAKRGQDAVHNKLQEAALIRGRQQAAMAAAGVDMSSGSPLRILTDSATMANLDAQIIGENASRESNRFANESANYRGQAAAYKQKATTGLLTDFMSAGNTVADHWYNRRMRSV